MGKKILIIDDAAAIRQVVSLTLSGYEVIEAGDGEEGLSKLKSSGADLIICDVNMPRMDGITFMKSLKNDAAYADYKFTPVIMLTTEAGDDMKAKGKDLGTKAWLVKPFKPEQLVEAVSKVIG